MRRAQITRGLARLLFRAGRSVVWLVGPIFVPALRSRRHFLAGHALSDVGEHERAAVAYATGLAYKPSAFHMWVKYGCSLKDAGKLVEASAALDRALLLDPGDPDLHALIRHLNGLAVQHGTAPEDYRPAGQELRRSLSPEGLAVLLRLVPESGRPVLRKLHGKDPTFIPLVLRVSSISGAVTEVA